MSWFSNMVDRDHDGSMLDDAAGAIGYGAGWVSHEAAEHVGAGGVPLLGEELPGRLQSAGNEWGDGMSSLLGSRDTSAPNAAGGVGAQTGSAARRAINPGVMGNVEGALGAVGGGVLGALAGGFAGPHGALAGAAAGSSAGALAGMTHGATIDHVINAVGHFAD